MIIYRCTVCGTMRALDGAQYVGECAAIGARWSLSSVTSPHGERDMPVINGFTLCGGTLETLRMAGIP